VSLTSTSADTDRELDYWAMMRHSGRVLSC
jgi:hypothetical protein